MSQTAAQGRGRPRSEKKHRRIMDSAMELFTRNGFEGTSVEDIAAAAGVSKQTVYAHFGCKETLFGLAVATKCKRSGVSPGELDPEIPPDRMLRDIARRFLVLITSPEAVRVHAVCTSSAETHPELGRIYFEQGPLKTITAVADYLQAQDRAGTLEIEDPRTAAWQFLSMLKAEQQLRAQFNLESMSTQALEEYVDHCVAMFLRAYSR